MCSWRDPLKAASTPGKALLVLAAATLNLGVPAQAQGTYPGIGRQATVSEVQAWDIDVRPDFKGLPKGAGSVAQGQVLWEAQCASCHGVFGEANNYFAPLVGGTTQADVKTGRVARLTDAGYPGRTTLMKLPSVSTLWDYIRRAMPWTTPKSLSTDEVYAVTAYVLHLGGVVPDGFVLSDTSIADAQRLLPNRNGATTDHGLWPGQRMGIQTGASDAPDVKAAACMTACAPEPGIASSLPDFARNNHGNLAAQQRLVGPQRGVETASATVNTAAGVTAIAKATPSTPTAFALAQTHNCTACHGLDTKIVGPGLRQIAARHTGRVDAAAYFAGKIKTGSQGVWGAVAMPPQTLSDADTRLLAQWLAAGADK